MEIVLFWFIFSIVIGIVASHRGRTGFGWFLLAILLSPVLMFILLVCLPSLKPPVSVVTVHEGSVTTRLTQLAELKASNAITQDEFDKAKAKILSQM